MFDPLINFFVGLWSGLIELLAVAWDLRWPIVVILFVVWIMGLMKRGKGFLTAGLIVTIIVPIAAFAASMSLQGLAWGVGELEQTEVEVRAESPQMDKAFDLFENFCGYAPSLCGLGDGDGDPGTYSGDASPGNRTVLPTPAPDLGGGNTNPNQGGGQGNAPAVGPTYELLTGEELLACSAMEYAKLRPTEKIPSRQFPYERRADGSSPRPTDWCPVGTQCVLVYHHPNLASNYWVLTNPAWGSIEVYLENTKEEGKPWKDWGTRQEFHPLEGNQTDVYVIQGTGDWPAACYIEVVPPTPEVTEAPPPPPKPTPTVLTCDYLGQATEGESLYNWIGSVPTSKVRELNPGIPIHKDGENPDPVLGIIWPDGYACP